MPLLFTTHATKSEFRTIPYTPSNHVFIFITWTLYVFPQFCILGLFEIYRSEVPFSLWPADLEQTVSSGYEGSVTL